MLFYTEILVDRNSIVSESTAIKMLYNSIANNGYFWCELEMCAFEMPLGEKGKKKKRERKAILEYSFHYPGL